MTSGPIVCAFLSANRKDLQQMKEILLLDILQGSEYTQSALCIHECRNGGLTETTTFYIRELSILGFCHLKKALKPIPQGHQGTIILE